MRKEEWGRAWCLRCAHMSTGGRGIGRQSEGLKKNRKGKGNFIPRRSGTREWEGLLSLPGPGCLGPRSWFVAWPFAHAAVSPSEVGNGLSLKKIFKNSGGKHGKRRLFFFIFLCFFPSFNLISFISPPSSLLPSLPSFPSSLPPSSYLLFFFLSFLITQPFILPKCTKQLLCVRLYVNYDRKDLTSEIWYNSIVKTLTHQAPC